METKALSKTRQGWPSLFENSNWIDRLVQAPFEDFFNFSRVINVPAVNASETDKTYNLSIATPGLEKKDLDVKIENGMLSISAEKEEKEEKDGKYRRREYNYSSWSRSFTLPEDSDESKIKAEVKNGELKIEIPKTGKKIHNGKNIPID